MNKYIKKSIEVEAVKFGGSMTHIAAINAWMTTGTYKEPAITTRDIASFEITTTEGTQVARAGDYIIKGVDGNFYPCSADNFAKTYTPVPSHWLDRVRVEQANLQKDLDALNTALDVPTKPMFISDEQWIFMTRQQFHMRQYNQILKDRIAHEEKLLNAVAANETSYSKGSESNIK